MGKQAEALTGESDILEERAVLPAVGTVGIMTSFRPADLEKLHALNTPGRARHCDDCSCYTPAPCASCLGSGLDPVWIAHALLSRDEDWANRLRGALEKAHVSDGACGDPGCCGVAYCCACSTASPCSTINVVHSSAEDWRRIMDSGIHIGLSDGICPVCRLDGIL